MTRARILADYVSSGDELADKAPLASPAFTGTPTGITAAHLEAGVLPADVTGGSGLTALGTVTAGNLSNTAIVYPAGHIVNVTNRINGTREVLTDFSSRVFETISVNKLVAGSTLIIIGNLSIAGDHTGYLQQGWKYGSGTEVLAQTTQYNGNAYGRSLSTQAVITGDTTTGTQNLVFRYYTATGTGTHRPFLVYNINATDDSRLGQTNSVFTIFEVLT